MTEKILSDAIVPDLHVYGEKRPMRNMSDSDLRVVHAKSTTIEARLSELTTLTDLVRLVEKYVMTDAFRVVVFWAVMIEWTYQRGLADLSDMADMNYRVAKDQFVTDRDSLSWQSVLTELNGSTVK